MAPAVSLRWHFRTHGTAVGMEVPHTGLRDDFPDFDLLCLLDLLLEVLEEVDELSSTHSLERGERGSRNQGENRAQYERQAAEREERFVPVSILWRVSFPPTFAWTGRTTSFAALALARLPKSCLVIVWVAEPAIVRPLNNTCTAREKSKRAMYE